MAVRPQSPEVRVRASLLSTFIPRARDAVDTHKYQSSWGGSEPLINTGLGGVQGQRARDNSNQYPNGCVPLEHRALLALVLLEHSPNEEVAYVKRSLRIGLRDPMSRKPRSTMNSSP